MSPRQFERVHLLPILLGFWFFVALLGTYLASVLKGEVPAVLPYISDTANYPPQSGFFAFMLFWGATLMSVIMFIRFKQVQEVLKETEGSKKCMETVNKFSTILGILGALGVCVVGDFTLAHARFVHEVAAAVSFGLGIVYQLLQTHVSVKLLSNIGNKGIIVFRIILSIISCLMHPICYATSLISRSKFKGKFHSNWKPEDGGWEMHLISVSSEWILALAAIAFLMSYTCEFKKIIITEPVIVIEKRNEH